MGRPAKSLDLSAQVRILQLSWDVWSSGMIFRLGRKGRGFDSCNVPMGFFKLSGAVDSVIGS